MKRFARLAGEVEDEMAEHEMSERGRRHGRTAAVVCVWCGSEIHRGCEPKT